jgi:aryl-alcohol dehydrogenase-like predicted oxidoreductase
MEPFVDAGYDIASAQVQYSLLDRRAQGRFSAWGAAHNVQILCYGVLAGGFLTDAWLGKPDPGFQFDNRSLIKYRLIIDEFGPWAQFQALLQTLRAVADKHGVALASVATRWVLDQPQVAGAMVGARYAHHLPQTLEAFTFALDSADRAAITAILAQAQGPNGPIFGLEGDRNGRHGRIMKYNLNTNPNDTVLAS